MGGGTCRRNGLELAPLLERHADRSPFHAPLFTAVVHKYPAVVPFLLRRKDGCDLQLTPALSFEHLLLTPDGQELPGADLSGQPNGPSGQVAGPDGQQALPIGQPAGRAFVRVPRPGQTESLSLLMAAASVGNVGALYDLLVEAGTGFAEEVVHYVWCYSSLTMQSYSDA